MKPRIKLLWAVALVLCGLIAWPMVVRYRLRASLRAYQHQLLVQGEKLTIAELTPATSAEADRAGNALVSLANRLRGASASFTNQPPAMVLVTPGHAIVGWQQDPLGTTDMTNVWPSLSVLMDAKEPLVAEARDVLQNPRLSVPLDYTQGANLLLPHLSLFKGLAQWLSADTLLALHEQRPDEAWESLEALAVLTQRYRDEPLMISLLVRVAIGSIAANTTWEALQSPALREPQLRQLQELWAAVDVFPQAEAALSMERTVHRDLFARSRESYANVAMVLSFSGNGAGGLGGSALSELAQLGKEVLDDPKQGFNKLARRYPGYWKWKGWQSYDDELAEAQTLQAALESVRSFRAQGAFVPALQHYEQAREAILQAHPRAGWYLGSLPRDSSMHTCLSRITSFETQRALLVTALALKRYQLRHGAYPAQLSALAPEFLPQAPRDPADGQTLRYRLRPEGTFLLYSVGEDGVDNGGDPSPPPGNTSFKRWLEARDAVWPAVAPAAETKAFFDELAAKRKPLSVQAEEALRKRYGLVRFPTPATNTTSQ